MIMDYGLIDLHVHTGASDGTLSARDTVFHAAKSGLKAVAITDHDTVGGVAEALQAGNEAGIEVVPGVEIGVDFPGEMHILGYYIDYSDPELLEGLRQLRFNREKRNLLMVEKLQQLNKDITIEEVIRAAGGDVVGRPHFAAVLKQKGYVRDHHDAFERYLGAGKPAYVSKDKITPREGIELVAAAGGIPVLAHPKYLKVSGSSALEGLVRELKVYGLQGIEVYYTTHTPEDTEKYRRLVQRYNLLATGGSDFHGANKPEIRIGRGTGGLTVEYRLLENLKKEAKFYG